MAYDYVCNLFSEQALDITEERFREAQDSGWMLALMESKFNRELAKRLRIGGTPPIVASNRE